MAFEACASSVSATKRIDFRVEDGDEVLQLIDCGRKIFIKNIERPNFESERNTNSE